MTPLGVIHAHTYPDIAERPEKNFRLRFGFPKPEAFRLEPADFEAFVEWDGESLLCTHVFIEGAKLPVGLHDPLLQALNTERQPFLPGLAA